MTRLFFMLLAIALLSGNQSTFAAEGTPLDSQVPNVKYDDVIKELDALKKEYMESQRSTFDPMGLDKDCKGPQSQTQDINHQGWFSCFSLAAQASYIHPIIWVNRKTECKECQNLVDAYNDLARGLMNLRFEVRNIEQSFQNSRNTTTGSNFRDKNLTDGKKGDRLSEEDEKVAANMLNTQMADATMYNEVRPKLKEQIRSLEVLAKNLDDGIQTCEFTMCTPADGSSQVLLADDLDLPIEWKGPYDPVCNRCAKLSQRLNEIPNLLFIEQSNIAKATAKKALNNAEIERIRAFSTADIEALREVDKNQLDNLMEHNKELDEDIDRAGRNTEKIMANFDATLALYNDCIKECGPKPKAENKQACAFPDVTPAITIGANSEVGSGAEFTNKVKDQAKGMAMGALNNALGGSGLSLGGGGGSKSKEPKEVRDPTSRYGDFNYGDFGGTKLGFRTAFTGTDELTVSTEIEGSPGDGTFHAQWLEDGAGNIYLPKEYLILELYRDWKLTVWWDYKRWKDGELVEHRHGEEVSFGRDTKRLAVWYEEPENAIWSTLAFGTATKGVKGLGSVFDVPYSTLASGCPLRLVTHISNPDQDPVITTPAVTYIHPPEQNDDTFVGALRTTFKF